MKLLASLFLLIATFVAYADLNTTIDQVRQSDSRAQLDKAVRDASGLEQYGITNLSAITQVTSDWEAEKNSLLVFLNSLKTTQTPSSTNNASETAKEIASSPIYQDGGVRESRNVIGDAVKNIVEALKDLFRSPEREINEPNLPRFGLLNLSFLTYAVWGIIGLVLIGMIFLVIKNFSGFAIAKKKKSRVGGLLEDDEPDRTADEWLAQADILENEGKFREAVRCLYLACLVRMDEHGLVRFERGQTNWEHLQRYESGVNQLADFDFRRPTQRFDLVWYGHVVKGSDDVRLFRDVYQKLLSSLKVTTGVTS